MGLVDFQPHEFVPPWDITTRMTGIAPAPIFPHRPAIWCTSGNCFHICELKTWIKLLEFLLTKNISIRTGILLASSSTEPPAPPSGYVSCNIALTAMGLKCGQWQKSLSIPDPQGADYRKKMTVNSLWSSDAISPIWHHRTWSTLVQVMASDSGTKPLPELMLTYVIINGVQPHSPKDQFTRSAQNINP